MQQNELTALQARLQHIRDTRRSPTWISVSESTWSEIVDSALNMAGLPGHRVDVRDVKGGEKSFDGLPVTLFSNEPGVAGGVSIGFDQH